MKISHLACLLTLTPAMAVGAAASDACSTDAILTSADVHVSDGKTYGVKSYFQTFDTAALRFTGEDDVLIAVEGPFAWRRGDDGGTLADGAMKSFALGHQFHALLLRFDEIVSDPHPVAEIEFNGAKLNGVAGGIPFGGVITRFSTEAGVTAGMRLAFPDTPNIDVTFLDWRGDGDGALPYHVQIDDQSRVFDYRYTAVQVETKSPLWFFDTINEPTIDEIQIHRLHRKLLAAHCLGDASMMARLTAPETVVASRGALIKSGSEETGVRFKGVFDRVRYDHYVDLQPPVIRVAESGDIGWAAVHVNARGASIADSEAFSDEWAWVMLAEKIGGVWRNAGNASNLKAE